MGFTDIVHHVAQVGEHVLEFVDGQRSITLNGHVLDEATVVQLAAHLAEAITRLGLGA